MELPEILMNTNYSKKPLIKEKHWGMLASYMLTLIGKTCNIVSVSIILRNDKGFQLSNQLFFAILNCFVMSLLLFRPNYIFQMLYEKVISLFYNAAFSPLNLICFDLQCA